ncbi:MAG: serine/threonine protein kinase [Candidatus Obscuribacter sp.]|nr:serine/threonine protein kinase [Candidatus Obscuribacter sp.]
MEPDTKSEKIKVSVVVAGEVDSALAVDEVAMPAVLTQEDASVLPVLPELGERYEVIEFIGAGGMGAVWKVRDKTLDTIIAAKVLLPNLLTDPVSIKRFEKEAALATELHHPNIAAIYGPGKDVNGNTFITMAYVQGETLAQVLSRDGALHEKRVLDIAMQVIEALVYSHSKGIVHRDITPSNIVITKAESGADLVRLVDFGIARCIYDERTVTQALTRAISAFGSPMYMSPEQLLGEEATAKSDVYSLGCVIFEMATGKPPFNDDSPVKGILQHLNSDPDLSKLSERLRPLVQMCLAKGPEERCSALSLHQSVSICREMRLSCWSRGVALSCRIGRLLVLCCSVRPHLPSCIIWERLSLML